MHAQLFICWLRSVEIWEFGAKCQLARSASTIEPTLKSIRTYIVHNNEVLTQRLVHTVPYVLYTAAASPQLNSLINNLSQTFRHSPQLENRLQLIVHFSPDMHVLQRTPLMPQRCAMNGVQLTMIILYEVQTVLLEKH